MKKLHTWMIQIIVVVMNKLIGMMKSRWIFHQVLVKQEGKKVLENENEAVW